MTKTQSTPAYYGNLARVAIQFAIAHNSLTEQHAAVIYARAAAHQAHARGVLRARQEAEKMATEFTLDAKADAIIDVALANADRYLSRDERDRLRETIQDAVDALIDECRDYYKVIYV